MLTTRHSGDRAPNSGLRELRPKAREGNAAWLKRSDIDYGIVLLGGSSLVEFRIRVAQSRLRQDLLPSFWSMAGIRRRTRIDTVADVRNLEAVPKNNAVQSVRLREIDDPDKYPNIAIVCFTEDHRAIRSAVRAVSEQRSLLDLPDLIVSWLGYLWGIPSQGNPLLEGKGLPSASLVHAAHALAGIELTPGHSAGTSCPEAIWQAAKWWTSYYAAAEKGDAVGEAAVNCPRGYYALRQPEARAVS